MPTATDGRARQLGLTPSAPASADLIVVAATPGPRPLAARLRAAAPAAVVALCVVAGVGLRVAAYARNPSLWIDEAMLALNVVHRTPAGLLTPLDLNQGAPVGYLLLSKLAVKWFGPGEYALRGPSLFAGLAGLALFAPLAYRTLSLPAARLAVALYALSPYLVAYSAEFKQYEVDAFVAVALMAVGRPVWAGAGGWRRSAGLAAAGAAAVWVSHPAAFVLGGVGLAVLADAAARRDRRGLLARVAVVGSWAVGFLLNYGLFVRRLGTNSYLRDYWAGEFLPLPPTRPGDLAWVVQHVLTFFEKPGGLADAAFGAGGLGAAAFLVGCLLLARTDWRLLAAVVTPLLLAMLASGLKLYPFSGRLLLFAVPAALLVVAVGAAVFADRVGRAVPGGGAAVLAVLFVAPVAACYADLKKPLHAEDARGAVAYVHDHWQPGDRAYVYYGAAPAVGYYHPRSPLPADAVVVGAENRGKDPRQFRDELRAFRGQKRVWVILAHRQATEEAALTAYLDDLGRRDEAVRLNDAVAMRYDLSGE